MLLKSLQQLQDTFLIDAYHEAIRLELCTDFIHLLLTEISHRKLIHETIN
ncbi:sporulation histidine kinase inhibitor Sda [Bacillus sp. AFS006103]|nr:sporulation histidine kinase inhibitor Sda [Bacillus sp. AFS006103]